MRVHLMLIGICCAGLAPASCASSGLVVGAPPPADEGRAASSRATGSDLPSDDGRSTPAATAEISVRGPALDPRTTQAVEALVRRDYARVLALSESPSDAPTGAWLDYDRGAALTGAGRTDDAVEVFKRAASRFESAGDELGQSVAIWGGARALDEAGRCPEARKAYREFETFARQRDGHAADMAAAYAETCRPLTILR